MQSAIRVLILVTAAALAGAVNATTRGLPWVADAVEVEQKNKVRNEVPKRHEELRRTAGITLEELKAKMQQGVIIFDARPREEFEKGHLAYQFNPPVLNIEPHKVGENLHRLNDLSGQPLVIYCTSNECELGEELYIALEPFSLFFDVKIYFPGWEGLKAAGMPVVAGPDVWAGYGGGEPAPEGEEDAPDNGEEQP